MSGCQTIDFTTFKTNMANDVNNFTPNNTLSNKINISNLFQDVNEKSCTFLDNNNCSLEECDQFRPQKPIDDTTNAVEGRDKRRALYLTTMGLSIIFLSPFALIVLLLIYYRIYNDFYNALKALFGGAFRNNTVNNPSIIEVIIVLVFGLAYCVLLGIIIDISIKLFRDDRKYEDVIIGGPDGDRVSELDKDYFKEDCEKTRDLLNQLKQYIGGLCGLSFVSFFILLYIYIDQLDDNSGMVERYPFGYGFILYSFTIFVLYMILLVSWAYTFKYNAGVYGYKCNSLLSRN